MGDGRKAMTRGTLSLVREREEDVKSFGVS
jgi:hypothetical protein